MYTELAEYKNLNTVGAVRKLYSSNSVKDRDEVLTVSSANSAVLSGIARHDVDVTAGTENDAILIAGYVDIYKLDSAVQTAVTAVESDLTKITFIKGAKV